VVVANDSDAAVGAPGTAGTSAPAGASATALSLSHASAGALAAQSRSNPSQVDDSDKRTHTESGISAGGNTGDAAAGLSQLSSNSPVSAPDAAPTPTLRVHANVDSSDFAQGLSDRVSWMVDNSVNGAKLQVNPPQLGPIELRISVQGDHAQVWMTTHSAVTRDALESSSPKLREMLGAQGFGQVSVDISQRSFQDRSAYTPPPYERASSADRNAAAPAVSTIAATAPRSSQGALDAYA
jgi:flagellar hook-length control protein FliK